MRKEISRVVSLAAVVAAVVLVMASPASAAFSITNFAVSSTSSLAGAHPDLTTDLQFSTIANGPFSTYPDGNLRDIKVDLPPGLLGDPHAVPQCSQVDFLASTCPAASQIGVAVAELSQNGILLPPQSYPVINVRPRNSEETAEIGFVANQVVFAHLEVSVRTDSDYGVTINSTGNSRIYGVHRVTLTTWGVPGDPSHDGERIDMINLSPVGPSQIARAPFLTNPTSCGGPLQFSVRANSYQEPDRYSTAQAQLPAQTGCDSVPFSPKFSFTPTSTVAGAPSGYHSVLELPESNSPDGQAAASLRNVVVKLPAGVAINPSGGVGLVGCEDASLKLATTVAASCPGAAKVGTAQFDVPALPGPLDGSIYLRPPLPGHLFRIVLVADGFGVHLKIPGEAQADPVTGQLTATFSDTPQAPVRSATLDFDGGPRAALVNPSACGTYTTHAELTPWSSSTAVSSDSTFQINQGCGKENTFAPGFTAGSEDPSAGAHTPFRVRITRDSGPAISTVDTVLPAGLLASIRDVVQCAEARAAAGTCGVESQVGRVTVGSGAGTSPIFLPQAGKSPTAVYLAGPYKGAPFSLSIVVPAQAGPFDLGTVVVRAGLYVDPITGQATVKADPMPTILEGIPLNVRDIRVDVDRPGFTFNPTNCDPQAITGTITSAAGQAVAVSSPFQAVDCDRLDLAPKIALALSGKGQTTDGKHPGVEASLTQPAGQSNLRKVKVTLPLSLALDPDNANGLCEFVDGSKVEPTCPQASIVGTATAVTPVLGQPLSGPVYFVKNIRKDPKSGREIRTLPKLVIPLTGENGVRLNLTGTSNVEDNHLVTTFDQIPDAPVTSFKLNIIGGKGGILVISGDKADICKSTQIADQEIDGQNGQDADTTIAIQTPACPTRIITKKITKRSVTVKVGGLGAGKLTVTGKGIKKTTKTIATSTVATVTAKRTKGKPGKITASFDPTGPAKARKTTK